VFQLIRAICADDSDHTQISLLYANNTEEDILLREELDGFVLQCPEKIMVQYVLAKPPGGWTGEAGFVTADMIAKYLPEAANDTKLLLCGPPPMIEATKKNLSTKGFTAPGAVSKAGDQIFLF
jgi:cytochrome-b5 reductase